MARTLIARTLLALTLALTIGLFAPIAAEAKGCKLELTENTPLEDIAAAITCLNRRIDRLEAALAGSKARAPRGDDKPKQYVLTRGKAGILTPDGIVVAVMDMGNSGAGWGTFRIDGKVVKLEIGQSYTLPQRSGAKCIMTLLERRSYRLIVQATC